MAREKLDKWLKLSGKLLIYTYIVMVVCVFIYAKVHPQQFTYEEKPLNKIDLGFETINGTLTIGPSNKQYYSISEIRQKKRQYYLFYAFNAVCLMGYLWFDPDKRKKINNFEKKLMEMLK